MYPIQTWDQFKCLFKKNGIVIDKLEIYYKQN